MLSRTATIADALITTKSLSGGLFLIISSSIFVALFSQISFQLTISPVPITGQTFAVLLVGGLLGARRGMVALSLYLAEGLLGLPVFAGGSSGPGVIIGPTGGYLVGFVLAAGLTGYLVEHGFGKTFFRTLFAFSLGYVVIFTCGLLWLSRFMPSLPDVFAAGLYPFLPGFVIKAVTSALLLPAAWEALAYLNGCPLDTPQPER